MDAKLRTLKSILAMVSPIESCITPPPEPQIPEDVSPVDSRPPLTKQQSCQAKTGEAIPQQDQSPSPKRRRKPMRRHTEPNVPRLNTTNTRRGSISLDLIFTPRPFEIILAERAYLISSLHHQTMQSRQLIGEYSAYQQQFDSPETHGKPRRRLRKKLGHLRTQLDMAAAQEKAIFMRLGEVYTELQSHAAWSEAALWRIPLQQQHQEPSYAGNPEEGYFAGYGNPFERQEPYRDTLNTPLDPTSPVFVPGQPIYAASDSSSAVRFTSDLSNSSALETVDETSEEDCSFDHVVEDVESQDGECDYDTDDDVYINTGCERRTSYDESALSPREKRLSLPSLQTLWPEE